MLARLLVLAAIGFPLGSAAASPPLGLPADFRLEATGPDGGTVWTGRIPNYFMSDPRLSDVYLPPGYNPGERYHKKRRKNDDRPKNCLESGQAHEIAFVN